MKYKKKPVVIEAVRWTGDNMDEVRHFCGRHALFVETVGMSVQPIQLTIRTLEGDMLASIGDYIICGVDGEFYPCKDYIFDQTYDRCE